MSRRCRRAARVPTFSKLSWILIILAGVFDVVGIAWLIYHAITDGIGVR